MLSGVIPDLEPVVCMQPCSRVQTHLALIQLGSGLGLGLGLELGSGPHHDLPPVNQASFLSILGMGTPLS